MPKNMSFGLTQEQMKAKNKTVTRRMGWAKLQAGESINAVNRTMGFKKGEHPVLIGKIRVLSVRREMLSEVNSEDVIKEGFPALSPDDFVTFFCQANNCPRNSIVTRIEFEHL